MEIYMLFIVLTAIVFIIALISSKEVRDTAIIISVVSTLISIYANQLKLSDWHDDHKAKKQRLQSDKLQLQSKLKSKFKEKMKGRGNNNITILDPNGTITPSEWNKANIPTHSYDISFAGQSPQPELKRVCEFKNRLVQDGSPLGQSPIVTAQSSFPDKPDDAILDPKTKMYRGPVIPPWSHYDNTRRGISGTSNGISDMKSHMESHAKSRMGCTYPAPYVQDETCVADEVRDFMNKSMNNPYDTFKNKSNFGTRKESFKAGPMQTKHQYDDLVQSEQGNLIKQLPTANPEDDARSKLWGVFTPMYTKLYSMQDEMNYRQRVASRHLGYFDHRKAEQDWWRSRNNKTINGLYRRLNPYVFKKYFENELNVREKQQWWSPDLYHT